MKISIINFQVNYDITCFIFIKKKINKVKLCNFSKLMIELGYPINDVEQDVALFY